MQASGSAPDLPDAGAAQASSAQARRRPSTARRWASRLSRWLALAVVALAPLPFGSVETAWVAIWCVAMAASLLLADIRYVSTAQMRILFAVLGVYACLLLVVTLQVFDISPDPAWLRAQALLGNDLGDISSDHRLPSAAAIGRSLLFVLVFCRFFLLGGDILRSEQLFRVVAWSGLGYALYGAFAFALDPGHILWRTKTAYLGNLTATFVNRNTAAVYLGSITILWAIPLISAIRRDRARQISIADRMWLVLSGRQPAMIGLIFGVLLCLGATAATGSRAGFILTLAALALVVALYGGMSWKLLRRHLWPTLGICLLAALLVEMLAGRVTTRLHLLGFDDEARLDVYLAGLGLLEQRPWLGWGLGRFEAVFAPVRPPAAGMTGVWDRAHSTPIELAIELGIPLTVLLSSCWLWALATLARGSLRYRSPIVIAGYAVGLIGTLHSTIDFSLQIPGFAVTFAALTAAGLAQIISPPRRKSDYIGLRRQRRRRRSSRSELSASPHVGR